MIEAALILWDIALPKLDGLTGQGGLLARVKAKMGSLILCVISLTYIGAINLCVLCVFVVFPIGDSETIQDIPYLYEKLCILIIS